VHCILDSSLMPAGVFAVEVKEKDWPAAPWFGRPGLVI
jgi:hypothetical protein